ncbi:hypothetical protein LT493_11105 [Streptomyces tricolor]|nr:hypothetical protein [Streptomyces tricolor]
MEDELFPAGARGGRAGRQHVVDRLDAERQRAPLAACRDWARPPAGLRTVRTPGGGTMTARQVSPGLALVPVRLRPHRRRRRRQPGEALS